MKDLICRYFYFPTKDTWAKHGIFKVSLLAATLYEQKHLDKALAKSPNVVTTSFGLQKVLPCHLCKLELFITKGYWPCTKVYESCRLTRGTGYYFIRTETVARSGLEGIASCLWKCLENLCRGIDDVRLRSSSYGDQNRNFPLSAILMFLASSNKIYTHVL